MKRLFLSIIISLFTLSAWSQVLHRGQIKGRIYDNETDSSLTAATVICLNAKDSSKSGVVFTDRNGRFIFDSLPSRNYYLYITYLGYKSLIYPVLIPEGANQLDIGNIPIQKTGIMLSEISILQKKSPIIIKKDTLEFNAGYFKTKEDDLVENLLRKIPGIQIDNNGVITVNGKVVESIMVNGHLMFGGGNLKDVNRNILADLVDKVQLIDKNDNSSARAFNNSGRSDKTINIILKKSKENIITGQLTAAYGTSGRYATKVSLSRFRKKQQLVFFENNDNINGLIDGPADQNTQPSKKFNTGINYSEDIEKKLSLNSNFMIDDNRITDNRKLSRETFIDASHNTYIQQANNTSHTNSYRFYTSIEYRIDSLQKVNFVNQIQKQKTYNIMTSKYSLIGSELEELNNGVTKNTNDNITQGFSSNLFYEKKFSKQGRLLNTTISFTKSNTKEIGSNYSNNHFQESNGESLIDTINQTNTISDMGSQIFTSLSYSEPVSKKASLTLSYAEDHLNQPITRNIYSYNPETGIYNILNDSLSNNFKYSSIQRYSKLGWTVKGEKFDYSLQVAGYIAKMNINDKKINEIVEIQNSGFLPSFLLKYKLKNNKDFNFIYFRNLQFPDIKSVKPIIDNSDPLYIKIGNPNLKPVKIESFNFIYNSVNTTHMRFLTMDLNGKIITNQIVNSITIDSTGRQIIKPINLDGAYNLGININGSIPIKKLSGTVKLNTNVSFNKDLNYTNEIKGSYKSIAIHQAIGYDYAFKEILDCSVSGSYYYNKVQYSNLQLNENTRYRFVFESNLNLSMGIIINCLISFEKTNTGIPSYNMNNMLMNFSVSKTLFNKQGLIKIQAFDLLNQNLRISRNQGENYIENIETNALQRFFILKFSYFLDRKNNNHI